MGLIGQKIILHKFRKTQKSSLFGEKSFFSEDTNIPSGEKTILSEEESNLSGEKSTYPLG